MPAIKLTPRVQKGIIDAVRKGEALTSACAKAGLDKSTAFQWFRGGSKDALEFKLKVDQAKAEHEALMVASIHRAATGRPTKQVKTTVREVVEIQETREPNGRVVKKPVKIKLKTVETVVGAEDDWRAALEFVRARNPAEWKPKDEVESSGEIRVIYENGDRDTAAELPSSPERGLVEPEEI